MPINCPQAILQPCWDCLCMVYSQHDDTCNIDPKNPVKVNVILTIEERLARIEDALEEVKWYAPSYVLADLRKSVNSIQGELRHFEGQFQEHIAPDKKKKLKTTKKGIINP